MMNNESDTIMERDKMFEQYRKLYNKTEKIQSQFTFGEFTHWCKEWDIVTAQLKTKLK